MSLVPLVPEDPGGQAAIDPSASTTPEDVLTLPWGIDPATSWLDYRCWLETVLDPGMALHKPLPQAASTPDTLAVVNMQSPVLDTTLPGQKGVNIKPNAAVNDVVQRMATSTYRFILRGYGLRAGYQIPIPGLVSVGNITAVPVFPQRAYNTMVGEFGGVPVWFAEWSLAYVITATPSPSQAVVPVPFDPALHLRPDAVLPQGIDVPLGLVDEDNRPGHVIHTIGGGIPIQKPLGG